MQNSALKNASVLRFELGSVVMTAGVSQLIKENGFQPIQYLRRHALGDWGDLEREEKLANEDAVLHGYRIFSAYNLKGFPESRVWVITEADRTVTTLLLPSEY